MRSNSFSGVGDAEVNAECIGVRRHCWIVISTPVAKNSRPSVVATRFFASAADDQSSEIITVDLQFMLFCVGYAGVQKQGRHWRSSKPIVGCFGVRCHRNQLKRLGASAHYSVSTRVLIVKAQTLHQWQVHTDALGGCFFKSCACIDLV